MPTNPTQNQTNNNMWPAIVAGVASLAGSALSHINANKNRHTQLSENEKNRQFNSSEAAKSRMYNTAMVNSQNAYNSPRQTMARLVDAGINPALAYSQGTGSLGSIGTGSTSQEASYSGGFTPVQPDYSGIQQAGLIAAQSAEAYSNANLKRVTANLTEKELSYFDKTKQKEFAVSDSIIYVNTSSGHLSEDKRAEVAKTCALIDERVKLIKQETNTEFWRTKLAEADAYIRDVEAYYSEESVQSAIAESVARANASNSSANLSVAQATEIYKLIQYKQAALEAQAKRDNKAASKLQNESAKLFKEIKEKFPVEVQALELDVLMRGMDADFYVSDKIAAYFAEALGIGVDFYTARTGRLKAPGKPSGRPVGFTLK